MKNRPLLILGAASLVAVTLAGCGGSGSSSDSPPTASSALETPPAETPAAESPAAETPESASPAGDDDAPDDEAVADGADLMDMDLPALTNAVAQAAGVDPATLTVECEDDTYPNVVGHTFDCWLNDGSTDFVLTITVTDTTGNVDFEITAEGRPAWAS